MCSCTIIYSNVHYLTESSIRIPGVPEEVNKQFREMLLKEKDVALAGDAKPATSDNGIYLFNNVSYRVIC